MKSLRPAAGNNEARSQEPKETPEPLGCRMAMGSESRLEHSYRVGKSRYWDSTGQSVRSRCVLRTGLLRGDSALAKTELADHEVANRGQFVIRIATDE